MIRTRRIRGSRLKLSQLPRIKLTRNVRDVIREHLRWAKKTIEHDLAGAWGIQPHSAHRIMYENGRGITPEHIEAVVKTLKLDEFDARELHTLAAIEAGWRIKPPEGP